MARKEKDEMRVDAICPIEFRYGRSQSRRIFTRKATLARYLQVESALTDALAEEGVVPEEAARDIAKAVKEGRVALARVDELEAQTHHDVMALVKALSEVAGSGAPYVHMGATSNDILDTARGLELKDAVELLRASLTDLIRSLARAAKLHKGTPMVGRTHGQHAVPTTFGYKVTTFVAELLRHRTRLDQMADRLTVGKMSGAVGTGASFGTLAEKVEKRTLNSLGLGVDEAPTQVTGRDRLAEFACWMAMVASTLDRIATEVRNLQRSEIGELSEPFNEATQVGSSTMAQKRNPISSENVSSLARLLRALPQPAFENMVQWHERDLANSANERFIYSHGVILLDEMLCRMKGIADGWRVDPERMRENLALGGGAVMSEGVMLELTRRGMPRQEAHELMRNLTRDLKQGETLLGRAKANATVRKWVKEEELEAFFTPKSYVIAAEEKTERCLKKFMAEIDS
jgi:adenylosuccinate lyase